MDNNRQRRPVTVSSVTSKKSRTNAIRAAAPPSAPLAPGNLRRGGNARPATNSTGASGGFVCDSVRMLEGTHTGTQTQGTNQLRSHSIRFDSVHRPNPVPVVESFG